jgi:hypothetical protein
VANQSGARSDYHRRNDDAIPASSEPPKSSSPTTATRIHHCLLKTAFPLALYLSPFYHIQPRWVGFGQTMRRSHALRHMPCLEAMRNLLYVHRLQRRTCILTSLSHHVPCTRKPLLLHQESPMRQHHRAHAHMFLPIRRHPHLHQLQPHLHLRSRVSSPA